MPVNGCIAFISVNAGLAFGILVAMIVNAAVPPGDSKAAAEGCRDAAVAAKGCRDAAAPAASNMIVNAAVP